MAEAALKEDLKIEPKAPMVPLRADRLLGGEFARQQWDITPAAGMPYEHLFEPGYMANIAKKMRRGDIIRVHPEDDAYFATLLVREVGPSWVQASEIDYKELPPLRPLSGSLAPMFRVRYAGQIGRWVVERADGHPLKEGFPTREAAQAWASTQMRATAR